MADPYKYRGNIFFRSGDAKQAIENYSRYLELDPAAEDSTQVQSLVDLLRSVDQQSVLEESEPSKE
jgi:tetratricopeptide (TPR) repeat protein